jgi:hypothetical protein
MEIINLTKSEKSQLKIGLFMQRECCMKNIDSNPEYYAKEIVQIDQLLQKLW